MAANPFACFEYNDVDEDADTLLSASPISGVGVVDDKTTPDAGPSSRTQAPIVIELDEEPLSALLTATCGSQSRATNVVAHSGAAAKRDEVNLSSASGTTGLDNPFAKFASAEQPLSPGTKARSVSKVEDGRRQVQSLPEKNASSFKREMATAPPMQQQQPMVQRPIQQQRQQPHSSPTRTGNASRNPFAKFACKRQASASTGDDVGDTFVSAFVSALPGIENASSKSEDQPKSRTLPWQQNQPNVNHNSSSSSSSGTSSNGSSSNGISSSASGSSSSSGSSSASSTGHSLETEIVAHLLDSQTGFSAKALSQKIPWSTIHELNSRLYAMMRDKVVERVISQVSPPFWKLQMSGSALESYLNIKLNGNDSADSAAVGNAKGSTIETEIVAQLTVSASGYSTVDLAQKLPHHTNRELNSRLYAMLQEGRLVRIYEPHSLVQKWVLPGSATALAVEEGQSKAKSQPPDVTKLRISVKNVCTLLLKLSEPEAMSSPKIRSWLSEIPMLKPLSEDSWSFPMDRYDEMASRLAGRRSAPAATPSWVFKCWKTAIMGHCPISEEMKLAPSTSEPRYKTDVPDAVRANAGVLLPYQVEAVRFGIERGGRVLVGDDMGLGKTLTALALAFEYEEEWPVLVICPPIVRHQWRDQILHWLGFTVVPDDVQLIMAGKDEVRENIKFLIVSYNLLASQEKFRRTALGATFEIVICDESHYIKDSGAQRTKATIPLLMNSRRAFLLSGTPSLNNAAEMHTQLDGLLKGALPSFRTFAERYAHKKAVRFGGRHFNRWLGVKNEAELGILMRSIMIRRKKEEVLKQLPSKRRQKNSYRAQ